MTTSVRSNHATDRRASVLDCVRRSRRFPGRVQTSIPRGEWIRSFQINVPRHSGVGASLCHRTPGRFNPFNSSSLQLFNLPALCPLDGG